MSKCANARFGFTLIELAIVLVIIGLVVGGVLTGRDLINAAQMRLLVSQVEKFNTAALTFKDKYKGLPGDMTNAAAYGFASGVGRIGNGDGCINICQTEFTYDGSYYMSQMDDLTIATQGFEISYFWRHLGQAKLVGGEYDGAVNFADNAVGKTMPAVVQKPKLGWLAYASQEIVPTDPSAAHDANAPGSVKLGPVHNYLSMFLVTDTNYIIPPLLPGEAFTPAQAKAADDKVDDGFPGAGAVRANYNYLDALAGYDWDLDLTYNDAIYHTDPPPGSPSNDDRWCAFMPSGTVRWVYNVQNGSTSCGIRFRAAF